MSDTLQQRSSKGNDAHENDGHSVKRNNHKGEHPNGKGKGKGNGSGKPARNKFIVVDGANVAWEDQTRQGKPKLTNLIAVRQALEAEGYQPVIIVDASFRHDVDDPDQLEALIEAKKVLQAPAGTAADFLVLETAARHNAMIVTNDRYKDWRDRFPWVEERRVPVMFVGGQAELYTPSLEGQPG